MFQPPSKPVHHHRQHHCLARRDDAALQRLEELLALSTHAPLRMLLHAALLPSAAAALRLAASAPSAPQGADPTRAASGKSRPGTGLGSGLEAAQQRGRAWALLGLLRLHLALPPAGADPAAKRALGAEHLDARLAEELLPELQVRMRLQSSLVPV